MYEAEQREAEMLFDMAGILKKAAEEMKRLAIRCDEYANSYDILNDDYEVIKKDCNKLYEENLHLAVELEKAKEAKPVVHAHWGKVREGLHICSNCKVKAPIESDEYGYMESLSAYCPLCGAQMDKKEGEENG